MDERSRQASPSAYNSVWELRADVWSSIADLMKRLADPALVPDGGADGERELGRLLDLVAPFESYWADPGPRRVGELPLTEGLVRSITMTLRRAACGSSHGGGSDGVSTVRPGRAFAMAVPPATSPVTAVIAPGTHGPATTARPRRAPT
jgi:hypothetical protein